jgi:serine/threonine protein kinase
MRDPLIGTRIDRYEIRESVHKSDVIGIYKAYDTKLERFVLIKTIVHSKDYSHDAIDYFLAESKSLAKLVHPNIAKVLDFGYDQGNLYLVSEYITGGPLSDLLNRPISWQHAINILLPLTNALIYAHSRGILHRDLKPDNIIINTDGQPILSDFSLMRIIEEEETRDMTGTNVGLGSPEYISPEQGQGLPVDFRSDIYSLGVIFFEMVTGKKLFYATSSMEIVIQHIMAEPPKPRSIIPTLPKTVEVVILNALSKDKEKRYPTMEAFANALKGVLEAENKDRKKSTSRSPRLIALYSLATLAVLVGIGLFVWTQSETPTLTEMMTGEPAKTQEPALPTLASMTSSLAAATATEQPSIPDGPFANFKLPDLPVLSGSPLPISSQVLDVNNAAAIRELARWQQPDIRQLAWIHSDRIIVAATSAGLYFFDPIDLSARRFFDTKGSVTIFAISKNEQLVATADQTGTVAVWNILDGSQVHQLQGTVKEVKSMVFSPDASALVFSDTAKNIFLWNLKLNQVFTFEQNRLTGVANKVMFNETGDTVLSGTDSFQVILWDASSGQWKEQFAADQRIQDMSLSSDGRYLALALDVATVQVFDIASRESISVSVIPDILDPITFVSFLPSSSNILTASTDGFVRNWNATGEVLIWQQTSASQEANPATTNPIKAFAVSQDGSKLVAGFKDGLVEIWDTSTQKRVVSQSLISIPIRRVTISPDDKTIGFQGGDSFVEILSMTDDTQSARVEGTLPRGNPISPNNDLIVVQQQNTLNLFSLSATEPRSVFVLYDVPPFGSVKFSPDGKFVTAFSNNVFHYWSTSTGAALKQSAIKRENQCQSVYRRDGTFLFASSNIGILYSDAHLTPFCGVRRHERALAEDFLADGSIMAMSLQNGLVETWDLRQNDPRPPKELQTDGDALDVTISKDGKLLAAASAGGSIEIYSFETMQLLKIIDLKTGPVNQVLFSNDGRYLIAGSSDGTLRFFGLYP